MITDRTGLQSVLLPLHIIIVVVVAVVLILLLLEKNLLTALKELI